MPPLALTTKDWILVWTGLEWKVRCWKGIMLPSENLSLPWELPSFSGSQPNFGCCKVFCLPYGFLLKRLLMGNKLLSARMSINFILKMSSLFFLARPQKMWQSALTLWVTKPSYGLYDQSPCFQTNIFKKGCLHLCLLETEVLQSFLN